MCFTYNYVHVKTDKMFANVCILRTLLCPQSQPSARLVSLWDWSGVYGRTIYIIFNKYISALVH